MTTSPITTARVLCVLAALGTAAAAQTTFPLDPRRTFLRTNNDSALPPLVVDLAAIGAAPGQWLLVQSTGGFRYISGGQDNYRSLIGVFSNGSTVLASSLQQRVPGAIPAGPAFASGGTYYGALPMDIAEDFFASRNTWADYVRVEVPVGATHLLLGVHDSLYGDNVDPNGDYAAIVTVVATPSLPGTGENLELRTSVAGAATLAPDVKAPLVGASMLAELRDPLGFCTGSLYVILGDTATTGGAVPSALPRLWVDDLIVLKAGIAPGASGWVDSWSLATPSGLTGVTLVVQGAALPPLARNGLFESTAAHRYDLP